MTAIDQAGVVWSGESPTIQVASGLLFPLLRPDPAAIYIRDIAAALAKLCRFTGHCREFYSVAQHSVLVSLAVPSEYARWGLLHDATEAYIGDIAKPLKVAFDALSPGVLKGIEERLMEAVAIRFGLIMPVPEPVHAADRALLATEKRDLMPSGGRSWPWLPPPLPDPIVPLRPREAESAFLVRYRELFGGGDA
jgi:hypothetical protein